MKKYDFLVCFLFLCTVCLFSLTNVQANLPLSGKLIYVDPGHGGVDPGSIVGDLYEKDINLALSKQLEVELTKLGASVLLTRDGDYDLGTPNATYRKKSDFDHRIKKIHESQADLYISIHLNFLLDSRYDGPQLFYNQKTDKNEKLAKHIQGVLNEKLNKKREIKKIPNSTYMYSKLSIPGVLVECGFLSNPNERYKLKTKEYQNQFASILAYAIGTFFNL